MTALRAQTIAKRKQRELVLDDFAVTAIAPALRVPLTFLWLLELVDRALVPIIGRLPAEIQVILSAAAVLVAASVYAVVMLARLAGRLLALVVRLASRLASRRREARASRPRVKPRPRRRSFRLPML